MAKMKYTGNFAADFTAMREEEEEEKRKSQGSSKIKQILAESGGGTPRSNTGTTSVSKTTSTMSPAEIVQAPSSVLRARRDEVEKLMPEFATKSNDPVVQYHALVRKLGGQDKVSDRMAKIKALWDSHMAPYDSSKVLWQLTNSPLSLTEIEAMLSKGGQTLFGPEGALAEAGMPARYASKLGFDLNDEEDMRRAMVSFQTGVGAGYSVKQAGVLSRSLSWMWEGTKDLAKDTWHYLVEVPGEAISPVTEPVNRFIEKQSMVKSPGEYTKDDWSAWKVLTAGGPTEEQRDLSWDSEEAQQLMHDSYSGLRTAVDVAGAAGGMGALKSAAGALGTLGEGATAAGAGRATIAGIQASKKATQAARTMTLFYGGSKAVEKTDVALAERLANKVEAASVDAYENPETIPGAAAELDTLLENVRNLGRDFSTAKRSQEIQEEIQRGIEENGVTIIGAYGTDLEADGLWTPEWEQALRDWWADNRRYNIEVQRRLVEAGYAPLSLQIDGLLRGDNANPDWIRALELAERDYDSQMEFATDHPLLAKFIEMTGMPITSAGAEAYFRRIFNQGTMTGLLDLLTLEPIKAVGGVYNALLSSLTYQIAKGGDSLYESLKTEWLEQVASGDARAEETKAKLMERQGYLLQNAFVPDPIMAASVGLGKDTQAAITWSQDHPDWVLAATLARDVALMGVTPKIKQAVRGEFRVPRTVESFLKSRLTKRVDEMVDWIQKDNGFAARETVGHGVDSPALVNDITKLYNGNWSNKATPAAISNLAKRSIAAAKDGDVTFFEKNFKVSATEAPSLLQRVRATKGDATLTNAAEVAKSAETEVARMLAKEQRAARKKGDEFFDVKNIARDYAATEYWANYKAVFPDADAPGQVKKTWKFNRELIHAIGEIKNDRVREFMSEGLRRFEKKPLRNLDVEYIYNNDRVFYNAVAATGDVAKALEYESRWSRNSNPNARIRLAKEIGEKFEKRYDTSSRTRQRFDDSAPPAVGVDPRTGLLIEEGTAALPVYLRYTADFGRVADMNLPYHILDNWSVSRKVVTKYLTNNVRRTSGILNKVSNPMRRWTVALGPLLFVKHSISDSSRTLIEMGPRALFNIKGEKAGLESRIATADPAVASHVRYRQARMRASIEHYYVGNVGIKVDWSGSQLYQIDPKTGKYSTPKMSQGVDAYRRIATDPLYRAWVEGGVEGVRSYLRSPKGHQFAARSGLYKKYKENGGNEFYEASDFGGSYYDAFVQHYINTHVRLLFEGLDDTAPQISAAMKEMAVGKRPANAKAIKEVIEEVNKDQVVENPYISLPDEVGHPLSSFLTGKLMTMNKVNRDATFNRTFNVAFDRMVKEGATPDQAAKVAADIADLTTTRIHFDLSNALSIEAQFRWAAWFATKHRLYNTYLTRLATERPSIAGAVQTFQRWLEDRNEDKNIPEWDKGTVAIPIDWIPGMSEGTEIRMNLGTIFWIGEQFQESAIMQLAESAGVRPLKYIPGSEWVTPPTMSEFPLSTGRWDQTIASLAAFIPMVDAKLKGEYSDEWAQKYLNGELDWPVVSWMSSTGAMNRIKKSMDVQMALAMHDGQELTPAQALFKAGYSSLAYQIVQWGKVWPGRIVFGSGERYDAIMREFNKKTPEERTQMLEDDPSIRFMFGIYSTNPVEQYSIVRGFTEVAKIYKQRAVALDDALSNGTIWDKNQVSSIFAYYDSLIEQMTDPEWLDDEGQPSPSFNESFAEVWNASGMADMSKEAIIQGAFPLADPRAVAEEGYIPNETQEKRKSDELNEAFAEEAKRRNMPFVTTADGSHPDTNDPAVFWLKQDMVIDPLNEYMKGQTRDGWTTAFKDTVARNLARGPGGPTAATKFLTQAHKNDVLAKYAKGTDGLAKAGYSGLPMFATMTTRDKEEMNWNSDSEAELLWRVYSIKVSDLSKRLDEQGINASSTLGKQMKAEIEAWAEQKAETNQQFGIEWRFSRSSLEERLIGIGIGSGDTKVDEGWSNFLSLVSAYKAELATTPVKNSRQVGVGPSAQSAAPVCWKYLPDVLTLKRAYPDWWDNLLSTFGGIKKFGFHWPMESDEDNELWQGQSITTYAPSSSGGE